MRLRLRTTTTTTTTTTSKTLGVAVFLLGVMVSSSVLARQNGKILARSINMPVEFRLCEHLHDAILYENDVPTSAMPAERTFQFTYYPDLGLVLPEQVRVEVAGRYKEDEEPFVTRLAVTIDDAAGTHAPSARHPPRAANPRLGVRAILQATRARDPCSHRAIGKNNAKPQGRKVRRLRR